MPEQKRTEPQKISLTLSPQAERYSRRDAPREARLMAARGALPLPPLELATVLFVLHHDPDPEVKDTARVSLESLPESVCEPVLSGPAHPALLAHLAHAFRDNEERLEKIALNPATNDTTIAFLAAQPFKQIVDIISNNQERMLRAPEIVDALGANPLTGRAVIDRILSFLGVRTEAPEAEADAEKEVSESEAEAALRAILGDELGQFARELIAESDEEIDLAEVEKNLYALIQKMSVFQKIKLGRMGNREARSLLIRDRNKIVAMAAITSPKITDNEVVSIAQSRNVCDDVLRAVSNNREWTKNYQVKLALTTNPRCPQAAALKFINYLQDKDLRHMMRSKDVPSAISTHARRILMKKGKL
ncbi:MAG: hypothetical protein OEM05_13755 [Myxococcales bacterium]|nr:hypothetical protein [Myxococcales bacterium]